MTDTTEQARARWADTIHQGGGRCPVCDRWGSIYRRGINRTMARSLLWLNAQQGDAEGWVNVPATGPKDVLRTNQLATLRWWGLIERKDNSDPKKRCSGLWRVTELGRQFSAATVRVPKFVYTYDAVVRMTSTETVAIADCFLDNFDYAASIYHGSNS